MNPLELFLFLTFLYYSFFYKLPLFLIYAGLLTLYIFVSEFMMKPNRQLNSWKKKQMAGYKGPSEGMIMVTQEIDVTNALPYVQELKSQTGLKITITHLAIKALGLGLEEFPEVHGHMKFGNFDRQEPLGLSVVACVDGGNDAIPYTLHNAHKKSIPEIAQFLNQRVKVARTTRDKEHLKRVNSVKSVPNFLNQLLSYIFTYIINNIGWDLKFLNLKRRIYGQSILTNVGVFGMKKGHSCLSPISGFNLFTAMGTVHK